MAPKLEVDIKANDQASAVIKKATENAKQGAQRIIESEKQISEATKLAARAKAEQLTLSQKMKFALAKEAAAGNKLETQLVNEQEALAKMERKLRAAIKAGDAESASLAKSVVQLKKSVKFKEVQIKVGAENAKSLAKQTEAIKQETAAAKTANLEKRNNQIQLLKKGLLGAAAAATTAAAGAFLLTKRIADQGGQMIKHAQQLGLEAEQFQKLDFAMKISGTSIEEQTGALNSFQKVARDATSGTGTAAEAFKLFGVTLKNNDGTMKSSNQLLLDMAEGYKKTPDGIRKSAAAMDIFGESGGKLHQFLELGTDGIAALGVEAESLGGVMSTKAAKGAEFFSDSLLRMQTVMAGSTRRMGEELMPIFARGMDQLAKSMIKIRAMYQRVFPGMVSFTRQAAEKLVPILTFMVKAFVGVASTVSLAWNGMLLVISEVVSGVLSGVNFMIRGINRFRSAANKLKEVPDAFAGVSEEIKKEMLKIAGASAATMAEIDNIGKAMLKNTEFKTGQGIPAQKKETEAVNETIAALKIKTDLEKDADKERKKALEEEEARMGAVSKAIVGMAVSNGKAFAQSFEGVIQGTKSAGRAMEDFAKSAVIAAIDVAETVILAAAAKAAVEAFAAHQWLPFVGFAVGSAAAAAAFGAAKSWIGTFAEGGIVPGIGDQAVPILAHAGEIVLPKNLSAMLLDVVGQRGGGSMQQGGVVAGGGGGVVVNFQDQSFMPKSPAELDLFLKRKLIPALSRLRRRGAFA